MWVVVGDIVHPRGWNYPERDLLGLSDKLRGRFMAKLATVHVQANNRPTVFMTGPLFEYNTSKEIPLK